MSFDILKFNGGLKQYGIKLLETSTTRSDTTAIKSSPRVMLALPRAECQWLLFWTQLNTLCAKDPQLWNTIRNVMPSALVQLTLAM